MTSAGAPAPKAPDELANPAPSPGVVSSYYPPPPYPPPQYGETKRLDNRASISLALAVAGLLLALPLGIPGLIFGPIAYFMGRAAVSRIDAAAGGLDGSNVAKVGWVLGIVATAVGAVISLIWLVVYLLSVAGIPPS
jgi:hypothetical protein